ncbi:hypothetical protein SDC9_203814 [bioreactor metagenome]|uniref:Uncharacterized protein n=1 Tax=bioreactor metagenome TaxID=1076179 RepID=A0A645IXJ0_9ZZZZ
MTKTQRMVGIFLSAALVAGAVGYGSRQITGVGFFPSLFSPFGPFGPLGYFSGRSSGYYSGVNSGVSSGTAGGVKNPAADMSSQIPT